MAWQDNALIFLSTNGTTWNKITDHNRDSMDISFERLGTDHRTVTGGMRRYSVAKKRKFSVSWSMLPAKRNTSYGGKTAITTVDNGWAGEEIEAFYNANDGLVYMKLRKGQDEAKAATDGTIETVQVMITEFSKTVVKRGVVDYWDLDITFEEI